MTDYQHTDADGDRVEVGILAGKAAVTVVDGYDSTSATSYIQDDEADRFVTALYDNAGLLPDVERGKADDLLMFTTHEGTRYAHEGGPCPPAYGVGDPYRGAGTAGDVGGYARRRGGAGGAGGAGG